MHTYRNPILRGFHPDPSICRAGDAYYLVTSTFEYFPGIPVYQSRDLVNWKLIGHCIHRSGQLCMDAITPSGGIWAPTIRYEDGVFYVTATLSRMGNFIVRATDPAGEWSDPVWVDIGGIDPSLYFEDGRAYYCTNDGLIPGAQGISLMEINPRTGETLQKPRRLWGGTGGGFLEAPHVYRIRGRYYLIAAEGGTGLNHMVTCAASDGLWGPYEACPMNPILTNRNDDTKQALSCGHADLFEDAHGNWWFVHLGTRSVVNLLSNLGRETFLTPAVWENGWFRAEGNKKARLRPQGPLDAPQAPDAEWIPDFSNAKWENEWLFIKRRLDENYLRAGGALSLRPAAPLTDEAAFPTAALVRSPDIRAEVRAMLRFQPEQIGDEAGLVAYLAPRFLYRLMKKREADGDYLMVEKLADDFHQVAYKAPAPEGALTLILRADRDKYAFFILDSDGREEKLCEASTRFLLTDLAGRCFTGTLLGLYAQRETETRALARFEAFSAAPLADA